MKTDPQTLIFEKKPISSANKVMRVSGAAPMFSSQLEHVIIFCSKPQTGFCVQEFSNEKCSKILIVKTTLKNIQWPEDYDSLHLQNFQYVHYLQ